MIKYVLKRIGMALLTLLIITFLLFVLVRIMPGNPFPSERMSAEQIANKRAEMGLDDPVVHLRYTHENVVMSLVCLLEVDNYGVQTDCLDSLETLGWADYRIAPLGGSIIIIHYRSGKDDPDPLVRVLLNGREARLPIPSDCTPYYHWNDMKRYYLRKLYTYTRERNDN
jgi:hypothetical protein